MARAASWVSDAASEGWCSLSEVAGVEANCGSHPRAGGVHCKWTRCWLETGIVVKMPWESSESVAFVESNGSVVRTCGSAQTMPMHPPGAFELRCSRGEAEQEPGARVGATPIQTAQVPISSALDAPTGNQHPRLSFG